ncbi:MULTISPECIES: hypothetical protein [Pseudomonas]|uniref:Uncharacterized protein n=1 Tax=Pseudomonas aphyarum TaxID=2942629 RepID=A0ABT5PSY6_9PSED|nr:MULTISPECIES: hypothetical protein [Pseudomonas]MDD0966684.1 hypothetical protein [Pseudomonas aphyarum]MDD1127029.1 hypothetical protein [Pseudomonas aphyarum]
MLTKMLPRVLMLLCAVSFSALAEPPLFSQYMIKDVYGGSVHSLVNKDTGSQWDGIRKDAIKGSVNFAGHYIVYTGGCGGSSICGEVIDAKTGEVIKTLPNAYKGEDEETGKPFDIEYHVDSSLIVIMGVTENKELGVDGNKVSHKYRTRYYDFDGKEFHLIMSEDE